MRDIFPCGDVVRVIPRGKLANPQGVIGLPEVGFRAHSAGRRAGRDEDRRLPTQCIAIFNTVARELPCDQLQFRQRRRLRRYQRFVAQETPPRVRLAKAQSAPPGQIRYADQKAP